jgi:hypothetical protein
MKLISYAHANRDLRNVLKAKKNEDLKSGGLNNGIIEDNNAKPYSLNMFHESKNLEAPYIQYPMNITPKNLGIFIFLFYFGFIFILQQEKTRYICIYIHVYICTYIYIYMYVYIYTIKSFVNLTFNTPLISPLKI